MREIDLSRIDLNLLVVFDDLMHTRSVTETATRLHKTQPAISHALQRLRRQLDDPLLVKQGREMVPSPHAQALIESIRPLLARIGQALAPPPPFDPLSTTRRFRMAAPDFAHRLLPTLLARLRSEAPQVSVDWLAVDAGMMRGLVDGGIDLVVARVFPRDPAEGLSHAELTPLQWATFLRTGHPAAQRWSLAAWRTAEHVQVHFGDRQDNPVNDQSGRAGIERRVAVRVPNLSMVAPLVAGSDLIATLPAVAMVDAVEHYGLQVRQPPLEMPPMPHRVYWASRLDKDSALAWFRRQVHAVFDAHIRSAHGAMPRSVRPSRRGRIR
jgi:DNA-binding transcriptional LysR family regulator